MICHILLLYDMFLELHSQEYSHIRQSDERAESSNDRQLHSMVFDSFGSAFRYILHDWSGSVSKHS